MRAWVLARTALEENQTRRIAMPRIRNISGVIGAGLVGLALLHAQSSEAKPTSVDVLRTFKTIYVQSKTPLAKPQLLAGELQKNANFDNWGLSVTNDPGEIGR